MFKMMSWTASWMLFLLVCDIMQPLNFTKGYVCIGTVCVVVSAGDCMMG